MTTGLHAVALCLTESADFNKVGNTCFLSGLGEAQLPVLGICTSAATDVPGNIAFFFSVAVFFFKPDLCVYIQLLLRSLSFLWMCILLLVAGPYTSSILLWCLEFNRYIYTSYWQMNSIKDLNSWSSRLGCQRSITKGSFKNAFAKT